MGDEAGRAEPASANSVISDTPSRDDARGSGSAGSTISGSARVLTGLEAVHGAAAAMWCVAIAMAGATAAVAFPTMKALSPQLPAFAATDEHWKIAAGQIAARMFAVADVVQLACALVCFGTLGVGLWLRSRHVQQRGRTWFWAARTLLMSGAAGLLAYQLFVLGPRMTMNLTRYWSLASSGDATGAAAARAAFDVDHPTSTTVLMATLAFALAMVVASLVQSFARDCAGGSR